LRKENDDGINRMDSNDTACRPCSNIGHVGTNLEKVEVIEKKEIK
jgi:hypothetical protein